MLFERGTRSFSGWFATHPPLLERIRALEPELRSARPARAGAAAAPARRVDTCGARRRQGSSRPRAAAATASPLERAGEIAAPAGRALREARARRGVPRHALARFEPARSSWRSRCPSDEPTRRQQLAFVEQQLGATRADALPADCSTRSPGVGRACACPCSSSRCRRCGSGRASSSPTSRSFWCASRQLETDAAAVRLRPAARAQDVSARLARAPRRAARASARTTARFALGRARPAANVAAFGSEQRGPRASGVRGRPRIRRLARGAGRPDVRAAGRGARSRAPRCCARRARRRFGRAKRSEFCAACSPRFAPTPVTATEERELFRVIAGALDCPLPPDVAF